MDKYDKERMAAKSYLKKYPFLKRIWEEADYARDNYHTALDLIEERMEKLALEHGIKEIRFAYLNEGPGPFGIDVGDVQSRGQNIKKGRILLHEDDFWEDNEKI